MPQCKVRPEAIRLSNHRHLPQMPGKPPEPLSPVRIRARESRYYFGDQGAYEVGLGARLQVVIGMVAGIRLGLLIT